MRILAYHAIILPWVRLAAMWLFAPAVAVVAWGELSPTAPSLPGPWAWDKMDHFTAYFGLAALGALGWRSRHSLAWVLFGVLGIGGSLECLQSWVGRDADWSDMAANSIGALGGLAVATAYLAIPPTPSRDR